MGTYNKHLVHLLSHLPRKNPQIWSCLRQNSRDSLPTHPRPLNSIGSDSNATQTERKPAALKHPCHRMKKLLQVTNRFTPKKKNLTALLSSPAYVETRGE